MGNTNLPELKGAESTQKPEQDSKPGEESIFNRMASLEARLKSFEESLLAWNKDEDEEDEEKEEMSATPAPAALEKKDEVNIQELVAKEIVKQFSSLGVANPPAPSVVEEKKEEKKLSFFEIVETKVKEGMTRGKAVEFVVANNPEAHMSYLETLGIYKK